MTHISTDDVRRLAALSSLSLDEDEVTGLQADLEQILSYIQQLGELDTTGVEPTYQVTDLENVWRDDTVDQGDSREKLLALAPKSQNNQIEVPKVL